MPINLSGLQIQGRAGLWERTDWSAESSAGRASFPLPNVYSVLGKLRACHPNDPSHSRAGVTQPARPLWLRSIGAAVIVGNCPFAQRRADPVPTNLPAVLSSSG